jgi:hypothetical protein
MAADQDDFRLEEYKALRKEVEIYLQESRALERYVVVAVAAALRANMSETLLVP